MPVSTAPSVSLTATFFRGFADPSRLSILETLRDGPCAVGDIASRTGLSQPNVSNHLRCLADCGLVVRERDGRFVYYALSDERIKDFLHLADTLLDDIARGVETCPRYAEARNAEARYTE